MSQSEQIAKELEHDDPRSAHTVLPLIYEQLRSLAARKLAAEPPGQTLNATALVHEAFLRVVGDRDEQKWGGKGHFYVAAAEAMRRILIDKARRRRAIKHGGDLKREPLDSVIVPAEKKTDELFAIHEALDQLAEEHPRKAQLVKMRYFVGLTIEEAGAILEISKATADRDWAFARAWLHREISKKE
ncbi:MAG: RNA polymerase sigma factor (TIGR02999 family) [Verrucomicrobiales bacterium]|jgi:RNA polymerase sigma factor (TIGR02999 family)